MEQTIENKMPVKILNSISFHFTISGEKYGYNFTVNKEVKKEDAEAIGAVMQKWLVQSLEKLV